MGASYPARSLSITIFCRPEEMPQPASMGGEAMGSEERPGTIIGTLDGLDRATFTSRRILGSGPSLEEALWKRSENDEGRERRLWLDCCVCASSQWYLVH